MLIVASGPSAAEAELAPYRGLVRAIAINESWRLAPWADVLYAGDASWWRHSRGCPDFQGLKVTVDKGAAHDWGLRQVECKMAGDRIETRAGLVGWGGNSGFGALNLAMQLGTRQIALIGYDLTLAAGLHWHGPHVNLKNPREAQILRWRRAVDGIAPVAEALGVTIINCSPVSMLEAFPKMPLAEALGAWQ